MTKPNKDSAEPPCLRCGHKGSYDYDSEQDMKFCVRCGLLQPMKISEARLRWENARALLKFQRPKSNPGDRCVCGHERKDHRFLGCYALTSERHSDCFCTRFRKAKGGKP